MALDDDAFDTMLAGWRAVQASGDIRPDSWEAALERMREEMLELRRSGTWRTGGLTLLRQLGLHHSEVILCRGLAWLLTPDGWHGLGDTFLKGFSAALGVAAEPLDGVTVSLEETRGVTRADIVVRYPSTAVLIEAKVFAGEQPGQADRLAREWSDEDPHLVFLTRDGRRPLTAIETADRWHLLRWSHVAELARNSARASPAPSPGACDLIETWTNYGG